jgi:hypothetical protein
MNIPSRSRATFPYIEGNLVAETTFRCRAFPFLNRTGIYCNPSLPNVTWVLSVRSTARSHRHFDFLV